MTKAFRCRHCGHLQAAESAGQHTVPHGCAVCGLGVIHTHDKDGTIATLKAQYGADQQFHVTSPVPNSYMVFVPQNWEVLVDATPERLAELGLTPADVAKHIPFRTVFNRLPDVQREYPHKGPTDDPTVCPACRHGGRSHVEGTVEVLTLPVHEEVRIPLSGAAPVNPNPKSVSVGVGDKVKTAEQVAT